MATLIPDLRSREVMLLHGTGSLSETPLLRSREASLLELSSEIATRLLWSEIPLLRSREASLLELSSEVATRLLRSEIPLHGRLHCRSCVIPVPFAVVAPEVTPGVYERSLRRRVHPAHGRRPHPAIHHHLMVSPVEAVISAGPVEATAEPDRSTHEEARTRPRKHHIRIVDRHIQESAHRLDIDVSALIHHLHLRTALQIPVLLRFAPQVLDRVHHSALVLHHCLTKSLSPARVRGHHLEDARILHQCLNRRIKGSA